MPPIHLILLVFAFVLAVVAAFAGWLGNARGWTAGWLAVACLALAGMVPQVLVLIIVVVLVMMLFGAFPAHNRYGYAGSGGWIGFLLIVLLILWLAGVLH